MSIEYTTYLILGIRIPETEFPGSIWDDRWLPYSEGHEGVEMRIIQGMNPVGDSTELPIYVGKVLAKWSRYDATDGFLKHIPSSELSIQVDSFLQRELRWTGESAKIMFFTIAN